MIKTDIDFKKPVLVTGANGYLGSWIVKELLERGLSVHAAVLNFKDKKRVSHLSRLAKDLSGTINFFETSLLVDGAYTRAMQNCELVIHTASPPRLLRSEVPSRDIVRPMLHGVRNLLTSVNATPSVKRVVLTSSLSTIFGSAQEAYSHPKHLVSEKYWNRTSTAINNPYAYAKLVSEKEAWSYANDQTRWDLVTINPGLMTGPAINPYADCESKNILQRLSSGLFKTGIIPMSTGMVDVRNVAKAHISAGFIEDAKGRFITAASDLHDFLELSNFLSEHYPNYPFPRKKVAKWVAFLSPSKFSLAPTRDSLALNIGYKFRIDNRKSVEVLDVHYTCIKEACLEFFKQLLEVGEIDF